MKVEHNNNLLSDDKLENVTGGAGNEPETLSGYIVSPRASWCPNCLQEVDGDSLSGPQFHSGVYSQIFECDKCNKPYIVKY